VDGRDSPGNKATGFEKTRAECHGQGRKKGSSIAPPPPFGITFITAWERPEKRIG
jgi:hypothetical protein